MHWLEHFFGFDAGQGNGAHYLFWSGAGSDLAYLTFLAAPFVYYRKVNCKQQGCPRIGHYEFTNPDTGVTRMLCWKHHPDVHAKRLTRERVAEIQKRRHLYLGDKPGKG